MNLKTIALLAFSLALFACAPQTADNGSLEPAASQSNQDDDALRTADQIPENESKEVAEPSVPIEPKTIESAGNTAAYPYPEPEVEIATSGAETGYPEPEADSLDTNTDSNMQAAEELPARATGPQSREVLIAMPDELNLIGTLNTNGDGQPQPAVLLLHMLGRTRADWESSGFSQTLNDAGYATLALDMRGHGESLSAVDWQLTEADIAIAWDWFVSQPEIDAENSFIMGASIGGNIALRTAVNRPSVKATVLLSPGLNYKGVTTDDAVATLDRQVLAFAMTGDSYSTETVNQLAEINPELVFANVAADGQAHGTGMIGVFEGLEASIISFLAAQQEQIN